MFIYHLSFLAFRRLQKVTKGEICGILIFDWRTAPGACGGTWRTWMIWTVADPGIEDPSSLRFDAASEDEDEPNSPAAETAPTCGEHNVICIMGEI